MKNFLLMIFLVISCSSLSLGQVGFEKGTLFLKGSSNMKVLFVDGTPINLSLGGAYFITDKISLGADLIFASSDGESDVSIAPFGRYYFGTKYFGGASFAKPSSLSGTISGDDEDYTLSLEVGYLFSLNELISIEPTVKYPLVKDSALILDLSFGLYINR